MDTADVVLLVDDNEDDQVFFNRAVKKNNFPFLIHWARDGEEAKDYLSGAGEYADRTKFPYPKFIITDMKMPLHDGKEFLTWLKSHPKLGVVPTIIFGGSGAAAEVEDAYKNLGAHSYMVKPATSNDLQRIVELIFGYWAVCLIPTHKFSQPEPVNS